MSISSVGAEEEVIQRNKTRDIMGIESGKIGKNGGKKNQPGKVAGSLKEVELRRRQVFKPVLDNPFTQQNVWPFVEPAVAETVMEFLELVLRDARIYKELEGKAKSLPEKPEVLKNITVGFNLTIGALEKQAQRLHNMGNCRQILNAGNEKDDTNTENLAEDENSLNLQYIFVCKFDMASVLLVQHFPLLCITALSCKKRVKLIQLPRGATIALSKAVGVPNTTILGMSGEFKLAQGLYETIENLVKDVDVPWLEQLLLKRAILKAPSIKVLSTSAPVMAKRNVQKKKKQLQNEKKDEGTKEEGKKKND